MGYAYGPVVEEVGGGEDFELDGFGLAGFDAEGLFGDGVAVVPEPTGSSLGH